MSVTLPPTGAGSPPDAEPGPGPAQPPAPTPPPHRDRRVTWLVAALVTAVAVIAALVTSLVWPDDGHNAAQTSPTTTARPTTVAPTTAPTTVATTTTTPPATMPVDTSTAVFPSGPHATGYASPVEAARQFAEGFAGFTNPIVGPYLAGDARSGEVQVRAIARGPVTTVLVRQLGADGSWWVLGSTTPTIVVDAPAAGAAVSSPLTVRGRAWGFEGAVSVEVRQDGTRTPLGVGKVVGGGDATRPFSGTITFSKPTADRGAVVFLTYSAENGQVLQAATLRVAFG